MWYKIAVFGWEMYWLNSAVLVQAALILMIMVRFYSSVKYY